MLQKGFISGKTKSGRFSRIPLTPVGRMMLFIGSAIIITPLIWLLIHPEKADEFQKIWLPFFGFGVLLIFLTMFKQLFAARKARKSRLFRP